MVFLAATALGGCAKSDDSSKESPRSVEPTSSECVAESLDQCAATRQKLVELEQGIAAAQDKGDAATALRLALEHRKNIELLNLYVNGTPTAEQLAALDSDYAAKSALLETDLARGVAGIGGNPDDHRDPGDPSATPNGNNNQGGTNAPGSELTINGERPAYLYHPEEIEAVAKVMHDFGDLYVAESPRNEAGGSSWEQVAVGQTWSGYWYPAYKEELYNTPEAPLSKLDRALSNAGREGGTANAEKAYWFGSGVPDPFEGHCVGWAIASVMSKEPTAPVDNNGVTFSVEDQKALLAKAYENYPIELYGVPYYGTADTDGRIQDLRPEAFHRLVLSQLGEAGKALVVDTHANFEVWAKPINKVRWTIAKDPNVANALLVKANTTFVNNRQYLDPEGPFTATETPQYEYRLYIDPANQKDGKFKVIAGEWIGESAGKHPDYAMIPKDGAPVASFNAQINNSMDVVRQILGIP